MEKEHRRLAMQTGYYRELEQSYEEMRQAKRSMVTRLEELEKLISEGNIEGAKGYIREMGAELTKKKVRSFTGNPFLDAVLNEKFLKAQEAGIYCEILSDSFRDLTMNPAFLCIVLSNGLDNAIEACERLEQSYVSGEGNEGKIKDVYIKVKLYRKNGLTIIITNSCLPVMVNEGKLSTSKNDKSFHGYGTVNMKMAVKELHGISMFRYEKGRFTFVANIPWKGDM